MPDVATATRVLAAALLVTGLASGRAAPQSQSLPSQATALEGATAHVYRDDGVAALQLYILEPPATLRSQQPDPGDRRARRRSKKRQNAASGQSNRGRPVIVFFFGGDWREGSVDQFLPHARYLAERGMVSVLADYRVRDRHGTTPHDAVRDAKAAIRWLRSRADQLAIDPDRIAAGGAASGAHLAVCTALVEGTNHEDDDLALSAHPNVLFLWSPPVDLDGYRTGPVSVLSDALAISPLHHIRPGAPPTVIFHGTADHLVPYEQVVGFVHRMKEAGNRAELMGFEGRPHTFFERDHDSGRTFVLTLEAVDRFLVALGWITGSPFAREHFDIPTP